MIYVVEVDIEVEAATPELAGEIVMNMLEDMDHDFFAAVKGVKEI